MAHSLEVRVPLLDHVLLEAASRIPPELQMFDETGTVCQKRLLKRHLERFTPGEVARTDKHGFGVPLHRWFSEELFDGVRERLIGGAGILDALFERRALHALVASRDSARDHAPRIWSLIFLQAWANVFRVAV
jgi:asparagine synthase (glutamine-hydrolysing)